MTVGSLTFADLYARLRQLWSVETGRRWKTDNPAAGQCGVTALVVNDEFGGSILKTDVNGGKRVDFTVSQFTSPILYEDVPSDRAEALLDCSQKQYDLLRSRVESAIPMAQIS
jgi:hypothetical protein